MKNNNLKQKQTAAAFVVGFVFALGLGISGMTQPEKVISFLRLGSGWDPSLMFVMLGAIPVHFVVYRFIKGKTSPLFDTKWHVPTSREINKPLIVGSLLFGLGWGLGGFCPGPAIASGGALQKEALVFLVTMTLGMLLYRKYSQKKA